MVGALDAAVEGKLTPDKLAWRSFGIQGGFASPVADGERLYLMDNGAVIMAFDLETGKKLWEKPLGTVQKASPVLADGKLYVGHRERQVLHHQADRERARDPRRGPARHRGGARKRSSPRRPSPAAGSTSRRWTRSTRSGRRARRRPRPSRGRRSRPTRRTRRRARRRADRPVRGAGEARRGRPATACGSSTRQRPLRARGAGRDLHARRPEGRLRRHGLHAGRRRRPGRRASSRPRPARSRATARVRVVAAAAVELRLRGHDRRGAAALLDQLHRQVLPARLRAAEGAHEAHRHPAHQARPALLRARRPLRLHRRGGRARDRASTARWATAASSRSATRSCCSATRRSSSCTRGRRTPTRTVEMPFAWKPETWYRVKLRVENRSDGTTAVQGKAWPAADSEPAAWTIDYVDTMPHRAGRRRHLRRRAGRALLRQRQGRPRTSEEDATRVRQALRFRGARCRARRSVRSPPPAPAPRAASGDWPMWGGTPIRNMVSDMRGPARRPGTSRRRRTCAGWRRSARRATATRSSSGGKVFLGTNNEGLRDPKQPGDRGVLMAFSEKDGAFLWQITHEKLAGGPRERLALPGRRQLAAGRGRPALLRLEPLRADVRRHRGLPRRRERRPLQGREAHRPSTTATSSGSST